MTIRPTGPCPAKIMIVGDFPGEREVMESAPFVGASGQELSRMLQEAGIMRSQCFLTTAIRARPPANDIENFIAARKADITANHLMIRDKFVLPVVRDGIEILKREIEMCQPNIIIALGNAALWALTGAWGITSWRGSVLECDLPLGLPYKPKVIPAYTPGMIFRQWTLRQIMVHDLSRAKSEAGTAELIRPDYSFVIRPSYETVLSILLSIYTQVLVRPGKLSVDIETRAGHVSCIGLAWSPTEALCIPLMDTLKPQGYWPEDQEATILFALYQLLSHKNCEVIGQNFSYDSQYFLRWFHFIPNLVRDTMLTQHAIFSNMPKSLDYLSSLYCKHHAYWKDEGKEWNPKIPEEDYWTYNCKDAVITFEVDDAQLATIEHMQKTWPQLPDLREFQQSLFGPVLRSMNRGLRVDTGLRMEFAMTLQDEIASREQWLIDVIGEPLNIKSPKQMKEFFYDFLGQKPIFNRKSGGISCDDESLRKLSDREPVLLPIVNKIQELRSLGVFLSTFVSAPSDVDGRMRCSFNIAGTETYRFSSSKNAFGSGLNLQNIPKGSDNDGLVLPNVRNLFVPDNGMTFFDIDLDSADLRIVAWEADVSEMKAMLAEGKKVYVEVMKEFYHNPAMTKESKEYGMFKSLCHGTHYLGTPKGLAERIGLGVHETEKIQKWYFGKFPNLKKYQDDIKDQVFKRRYVENIFGYRCYFFDRIEGTIFNQAAAWIPQSTVACLINRGYVAIDKDLPQVEVLLQVHDSLAGQFPTYLGDWMVRQIVDKAEIALPYAGDPLIIPVGVKTSLKSWGDCG